jgi:hypothetical protein
MVMVAFSFPRIVSSLLVLFSNLALAIHIVDGKGNQVIKTLKSFC